LSGFPGISTSFKCDAYQSTANGRWFSNIKNIKLQDISTKHKHTVVDESLKKPKLTGFLLKRKKSESRSISSENSYSMNKEPAMSKFSWAEAKSLFYPVDRWMGEQKIARVFAASDSLIVWLRPVQGKSQQELGFDCPFGLVCLFGYGSKEASYRHL
jgi:hypothetical protein